MPKPISQFALREQPIYWVRAIVCGAISAVLMATFIDVFQMIGMTPFSYEVYLGSLILYDASSPHAWIVGFLLNNISGAVFGILYAYCFEYVFQRSSSALGVFLGACHALVAGIAFFPFFNAIHEFMGIEIVSGFTHFGLFGSAYGPSTPILLFLGHLFFGLCMGTFYGAVRSQRVRAKIFEPGESGVPVSIGAIRTDQDPEDRIAI
jgi:hypothetical protein